MSAHSPADWRLLLETALIVIVQAIALKWIFWNSPLKHAPGFFFDVEVPPGFYEGEGANWLRRWRTLILVVNVTLALALIAILASGRWRLLPAWAGTVALLHVAAFNGFVGYARARLGAHPPVQARVAISFESRRLGDYFWWPGEVLMALITASCWALLFAHGDSQIRWSTPVVLTYVIVGLLFLEFGFVRGSFPPLPADRPDEHQRWVQAQRRYHVRVWDLFRGLLVTVFGAYAIEHGWHAVVASVWSRWLLVSVALAVWLVLVIFLLIGERRLTVMGRDLRPVGSWSTPFRAARTAPRSLTTLFFAWFGGLILLLVFLR